MSKFRLAKVRISESLLKVCIAYSLLLHKVMVGLY